MTKIRGFSKGTQQYLTYVGPRNYKIHPVIRSQSCSFLSIRFPRLVAADYGDLPKAAMTR